ncbi:putative E3 ubiquitin-protein ligase UBR7 [Teleopsis dalmanni]|uniref:putative E3 ubiquitin-protein ligase UBR7 n=1 Tax=Teleopsis dalmanni TaxID=139649 RepID=UPI0018CE4664|nr:putative E3 ubiquitin-protein ligase UBR7 [Teleopsis dalmanni]
MSETQNLEVAPEEDSVTMMDILQEQQNLEEACAAVLGASDAKRCTYENGPVKRQALYSCLTCNPVVGDNYENAAAVCLACSISCHENHQLVELYTKRFYQCDCPTERLGSNRCVLNPSLKLPMPNTKNKYNQNFAGLYCNCKRPYPDPENENERSMIQCALCEDWYHLNHIDYSTESEKVCDLNAEMVCNNCMKKYSFLQDYIGLSLQFVENANKTIDLNTTVEVGETTIGSDLDESIIKASEGFDKAVEDVKEMATSKMNGENADKKLIEKSIHVSDMVEINSDEIATSSKIDKLDEGHLKRSFVNCDPKKPTYVQDNISSDGALEPITKKRKLAEEAGTVGDKIDGGEQCTRPKQSDYVQGALFFEGATLREMICRCAKCLELYKSLNVEFITDKTDTTDSYEEQGKQRAPESSTYEQGIKALGTMGHVQQIEVISEYNGMMAKLKEYLQEFAVSNRVVTKSDVNEFFENMRKKKSENGAPSYFCR